MSAPDCCRPALAWLLYRDIGFLDAAKASPDHLCRVLHILGPSIASLDEIAETANFMQGAKSFLVKNFINDTQFFRWDQATYNSYFHHIKIATELTIPKLNEMAYEQVEVSSVPLFINSSPTRARTTKPLTTRSGCPRLCPALARQCLEQSSTTSS